MHIFIERFLSWQFKIKKIFSEMLELLFYIWDKDYPPLLIKIISQPLIMALIAAFTIECAKWAFYGKNWNLQWFWNTALYSGGLSLQLSPVTDNVIDPHQKSKTATRCLWTNALT